MLSITELSKEVKLLFGEDWTKSRGGMRRLFFRCFMGMEGKRSLPKVTGMNVRTIRRGCKEFEKGLADTPDDRVRRPGAGRPCKKNK